MNTQELSRLLEELLKEMVDDPKSLQIKVTEKTGGECLFQVAAAGSDLQRLADREQRTPKALASILSAMSRSDAFVPVVQFSSEAA